jgi:guanine deaminase
MRQGSKQVIAGPAAGDDEKTLAIDWKESLYLATKGGATALGLTTGVFDVGLPFDAQESMFIFVHTVHLPPDHTAVRLFDSNGTGVGPLDFFDLEASDNAETPVTIEMVEKWWCLGEVRNRVGMWVQGAKLDISPL